eukprot:22544-Rhodomonas_salina.1
MPWVKFLFPTAPVQPVPAYACPTRCPALKKCRKYETACASAMRCPVRLTWRTITLCVARC